MNIDNQPPAAAQPPSPLQKPPSSENNVFKRIRNATGVSSGNVPTYQTILIVFLTVFLILALLGINIFMVIGNLFQSAFDVIKPVTYNTLGDISYTTGSVIDSTSNLVTDTSKRGLDIMNGTIQDIGHLLIKASGKEEPKKEEEKNEDKKEGYSLYEPSSTDKTSYSSRYVELENDTYKTNSIYDPTKYASIY